MKDFYIRYALNGGFGGCENQEWEKIQAEDLEDALNEAESLAISEYESYESTHGLRDITQIMEEDDVNEKEALDIYIEERGNWLDFEARKEVP